MKIAFHSNQLSERGTEVALYKYAKYNEQILNNESIIISSGRKKNESLSKFKNFKVYLYKNECLDFSNNIEVINEINNFCTKEKIDILYTIKAGHNDNLVLPSVKTVVHCVFRMDQPHGAVYAGISEYVSKKYNENFKFVNHIVEKECSHITENLKDELNIPKEALVIGRYGGYDTFNLNIYATLLQALNFRKDLFFIFLNTRPFANHSRILFLPMSLEEEYKAKFVNTCDAMIHARADGETFGLAIAEFSSRNKPIITWLPKPSIASYDSAHLDFLQNDGIYYSTEADLLYILKNINKTYISSKTWGTYTTKLSPEIVMRDFKNVFLNIKE